MSDALLQYGAVGVLALFCLLAVRVLFTKLIEDLKSEKERGDRLEKELLELNKTTREKVVTVLSDATRAIADALAAVRKS